MKSKPKKTLSSVLAMVGILGLPAIAFANATGEASMFFKDSPVALSSAAQFVTVIQEPFSTKGTRMVFAKTLIRNNALGSRTAECRLDVIDTNVGSGQIICSDVGSVTLIANDGTPARGTVSMQCGQSATTAQINHAFFARVSCRNISGGTGVSAEHSKITTAFQANTTNAVIIQPGT